MPPQATGSVAVVAALESQRDGEAYAGYWRRLLLHGDPAAAYLYINDPAMTDLPADLRQRAVSQVLALVDDMELWTQGKPKPRLPDYPPVAQELIARRTEPVARVDVLAANAAQQADAASMVEVLVVYRASFADGTDKIERLVVRLVAATLTLSQKPNDAYFV